MKKRNKLPGSILVFIISIVILAQYPPSYPRMLYYQFFRINDPATTFRMLLRALPNRFALSILLYLFLAAAAFISAVFVIARILRSGRKAGKTKVEKKTEKQIETIEKSFQTAYKSGKERYLEQLDGFLESGYLDQKGYMELKKKYESMDIPYGF